MTRSDVRFMLSVFFFAALSSCGVSHETAELCIDAHFVTTGSSTEVVVILHSIDKPTSYLSLEKGDSLHVTVGSQTTELKDGRVLTGFIPKLLSGPTYSALLSAKTADTLFTIALRRSSEESAEHSSVTQPQPFDLKTPAPPTLFKPAQRFSRASDSVTVTWSPAGTNDRMRLYLHGGWVEDYEQAIQGDTGTATIPPKTIRIKPEASSDSVTAYPTLELSRERSGTLDPAFGEGGSIVARQVRTSKIESVP